MLSEVNAEVNKKNVECVKPESNERNTLNVDQNEVVGNEHRGNGKMLKSVKQESKERKTPRGPN